MKTCILTQSDVTRVAQLLVETLHRSQLLSPINRIYGVPRGGVPVAYVLAPLLKAEIVDNPEDADLIVDDIIDSGETRQRFSDHAFAALFSKQRIDTPFTFTGGYINKWVVFPWEENDKDSSEEDICRRLLQLIGEDVTRGGLIETPRRFLKAWREWTRGYHEDPADMFKTFEDGAENYDQMIIVRDIPIFSHCEHHLAAIFGTAHIGYIPNGRIIGLSKLARLADLFARRLQVQERLTNQIADAIEEHLKPQGVAVIIQARHFCMESRGVEKMGAATVTSAMRGVFRGEPEARAEFMSLIR